MYTMHAQLLSSALSMYPSNETIYSPSDLGVPLVSI
jgi:hypothetical protein